MLGRSPLLAGVLRPIIVAFYSVPLIALAPLFIMFFGLDMLPKIVLVAIVVFFLLFFNTFAGATSVDHDLIAQVELMGSTPREKFQKVVAPACMAWIIGGIKVGAALRAGGRHHRRDAGGAARPGLPAERRGVAVRHDVALCGAVHPDAARPRGLGSGCLGGTASAAVAPCRGVTAPKIRLAGVGKTLRHARPRDRGAAADRPGGASAHEFVALVGPSGCGKSTILNLVAGLLPPSGGVVSLRRRAGGRLNRQVGYMTQKDTLLPWRSAADNIRIALELKCRAVPRGRGG